MILRQLKSTSTETEISQTGTQKDMLDRWVRNACLMGDKARFVSGLFRNPEERFSPLTAHTYRLLPPFLLPPLPRRQIDNSRAERCEYRRLSWLTGLSGSFSPPPGMGDGSQPSIER